MSADRIDKFLKIFRYSFYKDLVMTLKRESCASYIALCSSNEWKYQFLIFDNKGWEKFMIILAS